MLGVIEAMRRRMSVSGISDSGVSESDSNTGGPSSNTVPPNNNDSSRSSSFSRSVRSKIITKDLPLSPLTSRRKVLKPPMIRINSVDEPLDTSEEEHNISPDESWVNLELQQGAGEEEVTEDTGNTAMNLLLTVPESDENSPPVINLEESHPAPASLKILEPIKPPTKRRNTITDIFRWLIESDIKPSSHRASSTPRRRSRILSESDSEEASNLSETGSVIDLEEDLWITWGRIVSDWDTHWKKKNQFVRNLIQSGIPFHFRGIVWQLLSSAYDSEDKTKYADYIKKSSACEKDIRRDIARTYPEHDFFKEEFGRGQESLFNVMKAYSLHDREVGYCQGSAFIVGLLLMQMPEEDAFAVIVKVMKDYHLREMFTPSMSELGLYMYQLEMSIQEILPDLYVHFQSQGVHTTMYASSWFLTLFTTNLPLPIASRIMDLFLMDGMEVVFRIALAVLTIAKEELLQLDMEGVLKHLQKDVPSRVLNDTDILFNTAANIKYNSKKMKKLEKDYATMKAKEQEEMVEVRRLRAENKLLQQRVSMLEAESSELANNLIQGQVLRAEEVETTLVLKKELASLRKQYLETMKQLVNMTQQYQQMLSVLEENNSAYNKSPKLCSQEEPTSTSDLVKKEDLIQRLQNELVEIRLHSTANAVIMCDLRTRIQELEEVNIELKEGKPGQMIEGDDRKLVELETQAQLTSYQLRCQEDETQRLKDQLEQALRENGELTGKLSNKELITPPPTLDLNQMISELRFNGNPDLLELEKELILEPLELELGMMPPSYYDNKRKMKEKRSNSEPYYAQNTWRDCNCMRELETFFQTRNSDVINYQDLRNIRRVSYHILLPVNNDK